MLAVAVALEAAEQHLADLDARAGDGDLGASMVRAAETLRVLAAGPAWSPPAMLAQAADGLRRSIGGSSGPFYAAGLLRASRRLPDAPTALDWADAFADAVAAISELGGAQPGDRTMIDALAPAAATLRRSTQDRLSLGEILHAAALAAEAEAQATAAMAPRLGRASYLGNRALGIPDAGAVAVAVWLRALAEHFGQ